MQMLTSPKYLRKGSTIRRLFPVPSKDSGFETTVFTRNIREIGRRKFVAVVIIEETNTKGINRLKKVVRWWWFHKEEKKANANVFISSPDSNLSQNGTLGLLLLLYLETQYKDIGFQNVSFNIIQNKLNQFRHT